MGISLGSPTGDVVRVTERGSQEIPDGIAYAKAFLKKRQAAKIVVVVDTHCLDNGAFVYEGSTPQTYSGCRLEEVRLQDCHIPHPASSQPTDPPGLHSRRRLSIRFQQCEEDPRTQPQEHHPQSRMRTIN